MIRIAEKEDLQQVSKILQAFFPEHNIFSANESIVQTYLQTQVDTLLVHENDRNEITGATYIVQTGQDITQTHKIWKFRHFAYQDEETAKALLLEAENHISKESQTAKIELTIADGETGLEFYKKNGYVQEGALANHYRFGETCYILGKTLNT